MKLGKYLASSSGSSYSPSSTLTVLVLFFLIWICFDRLTMRDKLCSADSSMVPIELYTKYELSNKASKKILVSWFLSSLKAPIPSESTTKHLNGFSEFLSTKSMGLFHTQSPLVHGLIVGPTPKPFYFCYSSIIRLSRNDLPVLYIPATAMTPTGSSPRLISSSRAS